MVRIISDTSSFPSSAIKKNNVQFGGNQKSTKNTRAPESTVLLIACSIHKRASEVKCRANCLRSVFPFSCKSNQVQVKLPITLAIVLVMGMGLKTLSRSYVGYPVIINLRYKSATIQNFVRVGTYRFLFMIGSVYLLLQGSF